MRVLGFLLLIALARGQINIETVCRSVVNALDCRRFPFKPICATGGVQFSTECDFTKAHCLDSNLKVISEGTCPTGITVPATTADAGTTQAIVDTTPDAGTTPMVDTTPDAGTTPMVDITPDAGTTPMVPDTTMTDAGVTMTIPPDTPAAVTSDVPMTSADTTMMTTTGMMETTTDPNLSEVCNKVVNTPCGDDVNQLCATNGNTYTNYCEYSKARCYFPDIHVAYTGTCSSTDTFATFTTMPPATLPPSVFDIICRTLQQVTCENDGIQVCGSNGVTYVTACDFEKAKCFNPDLTIQDC